MTDPITREQVERAIDQAVTGHFVIMPQHFGGDAWRDAIPDYVRSGYDVSFDALVRALTRWRDELAAAEPARRVARWDGMAYALDPHHVIGEAHIVRETREEAIAWGYEIEGGPEPKPAEDSPERLRERREALGWHRARTADGLPLLWHDIERLETGRTDDDAADRARYAAALSAEESRRAKLLTIDQMADALVGSLVAAGECEADGKPEGAAVDYVRALITRLRAAEARIERVGAILIDEGCDCYCDCDSDGHNADCDLCLACRIDREVSP